MNEKKYHDYTELAERLEYGHSERFLHILEYLMTPEQAAIVVQLPKTPEELSETLCIDIDTIKRHIDALFRKGESSF